MKLLTWIITVPYLILFVGILVTFEILQRLGSLIGDRGFYAAFYLMNICLVENFKTVGTRMKVSFDTQLPADKPLIIVSNHQSMYDIPLMIRHLRKHHPKFVAKTELAKYYPGISYALHRMGSALIDRKDPRQALPTIKKFGERVNANKECACIFPEGTRGRGGKVRKFKPSGFVALLESMPDAVIVPAYIDGSWEMLKHNLLPVPLGVRVNIRFMAPVARGGNDPQELLREIETLIKTELAELRGVPFEEVLQEAA